MVCVMKWILHNKHYSMEVKISIVIVIVIEWVSTLKLM